MKFKLGGMVWAAAGTGGSFIDGEEVAWSSRCGDFSCYYLGQSLLDHVDVAVGVATKR